MAKTTPTVTTSTTLSADARIKNSHTGHPVTRVGSFTDPKQSTTPFEVFYCQKDHELIIDAS